MMNAEKDLKPLRSASVRGVTKVFVQKQIRNGRRILNKTTLTLTLSRPTGEGTARPVAGSFSSGWTRRPSEDDSPSPIGCIGWERAGVRVSEFSNPKLFLHEPYSTPICFAQSF